MPRTPADAAAAGGTPRCRLCVSPVADGDSVTEWQRLLLASVTSPGCSLDLTNMYIPPDVASGRLWTTSRLPAGPRSLLCADANAFHPSWATPDDERRGGARERSEGVLRGAKLAQWAAAAGVAVLNVGSVTRKGSHHQATPGASQCFFSW